LLKYKRTLWVALAVLFVVAIFFVKNNTTFKNQPALVPGETKDGLVYGNETLEDFVNKDTDGDTVLDWQENLYGLDPTKKETTAGTPDSVVINKIKTLQNDGSGEPLLKSIGSANEENLSQTDKFSRELFATIVAANQSGIMDQAKIEELSASLAEHIQNSPPRKVFYIFDIKTTSDNSVQAFKNYNKALNDIYTKYPPINYTILDVLEKFMIDENDVDASALLKLDPIITQTNKIIDAMVKTAAPQSISALHLSVINSLERLMENISDMKLYESDVIVALGGISKYQDSANRLESDLNALSNAINQKLRSEQ